MNLINFLATGVGIIRFIFNGIKIGVPVILIIVGMFEMGKAITKQNEDEIKKAQSQLVKKAIAALVVFLMFQMVQLLMSVMNMKDTSNWACVKVILNEPKAGDECKKGDGASAETGSWTKSGSGDDEVWKCS